MSSTPAAPISSIHVLSPASIALRTPAHHVLCPGSAHLFIHVVRSASLAFQIPAYHVFCPGSAHLLIHVLSHEIRCFIGPAAANGTTDGAPLQRSPTSLARLVIASPCGLSLFSEFPRVCVVLGDAERLEREVMKLVGAMERDGVAVRTVWVRDAPRDVLMLGWWDERVRDGVWAQAGEWVAQA